MEVLVVLWNVTLPAYWPTKNLFSRQNKETLNVLHYSLHNWNISPKISHYCFFSNAVVVNLPSFVNIDLKKLVLCILQRLAALSFLVSHWAAATRSLRFSASAQSSAPMSFWNERAHSTIVSSGYSCAIAKKAGRVITWTPCMASTCGSNSTHLKIGSGGTKRCVTLYIHSLWCSPISSFPKL
jgi:hypothetical protein